MMAALLDDWALPFGARRSEAAPGSGRGHGPRGAGLTFPKWLLSGDLDDDDDDDRPVLRRSRSTWATWPSGSQDEDGDGDGQGEDAADAAWWTAAGPRRRPRSWAPRHPRDHDEEPRTPRGGSRRYFDYTPRRDGRDNTDALHGHHHDRSRQRSSSAHNPSQRVAFSDAVGGGHGGGRPAYRDVPIARDTAASTARGRAGSRRDEQPPVVSREVPVTTARDGTTATVRNIPVTREDSAPPPATPQVEQPATPPSPPRSRNIRIELSDSHPDLHGHGLRASVRVEADAAPAREAPAKATAEEGETSWPKRPDPAATARVSSATWRSSFRTAVISRYVATSSHAQ